MNQEGRKKRPRGGVYRSPRPGNVEVLGTRQVYRSCRPGHPVDLGTRWV